MSVKEFEDVFWRYYLILEERFENATRYIELDADNYPTFSIEFVNQMNAIGSEMDVLMKLMCDFPSGERKTIADYANVILPNYSGITNYEVVVRGIEIKPFDGWDAGAAAKSLSWWEAYQSVKHGRNGEFRKANLENVLYLIAGLYLLEMLYFKKLADLAGEPDVLQRESELFTIKGWESRFYPSSRLIFGAADN